MGRYPTVGDVEDDMAVAAVDGRCAERVGIM